MPPEFKDASEEVRQLRDTGIFPIAFTHAAPHHARVGVEKTGKLMAPKIALAHDVVPFAGEPNHRTFPFRAYHVSVTDVSLGSGQHNWRQYAHNAQLRWSPEASAGLISFLEEEKKKTEEAPYTLRDHMEPGARKTRVLMLEEYIELERIKQQRWLILPDEQKHAIQNPERDVYVFDERLREAVGYGPVFGKRFHVDHPYAYAEINLRRYLTGMFTSAMIDETRKWISGVIGREVPVGSLDALATWDPKG